MKNFKKVLALVLAVVMLLSFATVASAVTSDYYKDTDDIDYKEAVDVLGAIGVLNGFPDDTFRPDATITRAQSAKIIAMFDNGSTDINKLYTAANPFSDCVDHWAESYIAYGAKTGILAGYASGKFLPEEKVTGVQFLKMTLVVLGYNAKTEGLEGKNWDVNTLALAKRVGLTATLGNKFDYSADLKRQEAAVIMLDALRSETVEYGSTLGVNVSKFEQAIKDWNALDPFYGVNLNGLYYMTVAGAVKTGELLGKQWNLTEGYYEDVFMRPYRTWELKGNIIGKYMFPVAEYTTAKTLCDVLVDIGVAKTDYRTTLNLQHYVNGEEEVLTNATAHHNFANQPCALLSEAVGSQGTLTQVFKVGNGTYRITEIETWLGRVSNVDTSRTYRDGHLAKEDLVTVEVSLDGTLDNSKDYNNPDAITVQFPTTEKFSKGQWVLVNYSVKDAGLHNTQGATNPTASNTDCGVANVTAAKTETAQFTGYDSVETKVGANWLYDAVHFFIGNTGTTYGAGFPLINGFDRVKLPANIGGYFGFVYDAYGNVIGMYTPSMDVQYLVVDWMYMIAETGNEILKADVVGLDAKTTSAATVASLDGYKPAHWITGTMTQYGPEYGLNWAGRYDVLYTYGQNSDGEYALTTANGTRKTNTDISIIEGKAYLYENGNPIAVLTDDTQILVHEMDGTYTATTGKEVGTIYASNVEFIDDGSFATVVYLYGGSNGYVYRENSKSTGFVAIDVYDDPKVELIGGKELVKTVIYFNGEAKEVYVEHASFDALVYGGSGFYTVRFTDKVADVAVVEIVEKQADANTEYTMYDFSGNTLKTDKGSFKVAADVVIYDVYLGEVTKVEEFTSANLLLGFNAAGIVNAIYCIVNPLA